MCGLLPQGPIEGKDEIEVGYLFVKKFWGQGLATEAARAMMDAGFNELKLDRIISIINPNNKRSIAVAKRNGLAKETETIYKGRKAAVYVCSMTATKKSC